MSFCRVKFKADHNLTENKRFLRWCEGVLRCFCLNDILRTAAFQKILTVSNLQNKLSHYYRIYCNKSFQWIPYGEEALLQ